MGGCDFGSWRGGGGRGVKKKMGGGGGGDLVTSFVCLVFFS